MLCTISEEQKSHLHYGRSLKSPHKRTCRWNQKVTNTFSGVELCSMPALGSSQAPTAKQLQQ
jgi:hypothetical protein